MLKVTWRKLCAILLCLKAKRNVLKSWQKLLTYNLMYALSLFKTQLFPFPRI